MPYATVEELAAALRLKVTPENTPTLEACLNAAALEINHYVDRRPVELLVSDWFYDAATAAADPGAGKLRMNKTSMAAVSALYLSTLDADGYDHTDTAAVLVAGDLVRVMAPADPGRFEQFTLEDVPTDNGGWLTIPVTWTASGGLAVTALPTLVTGDRVSVTALQVTPALEQGAALVNRVNVLRGVEWWKANDAAFGVIGFDETGSLTVPRDTFARHGRTLVPLKQRWGVA